MTICKVCYFDFVHLWRPYGQGVCKSYQYALTVCHQLPWDLRETTSPTAHRLAGLGIPLHRLLRSCCRPYAARNSGLTKKRQGALVIPTWRRHSEPGLRPTIQLSATGHIEKIANFRNRSDESLHSAQPTSRCIIILITEEAPQVFAPNPPNSLPSFGPTILVPILTVDCHLKVRVHWGPTVHAAYVTPAPIDRELNHVTSPLPAESVYALDSYRFELVRQCRIPG